MRKSIIAVVAGAALLIPAVAPATEVREPESCFAAYGAMPSCSFTVTSESSSGTVTGAVGPGTWVVVVKRGKKKITIKSPAEPGPVAFPFEVDDKVSATVTGPGWVLVGHD